MNKKGFLAVLVVPLSLLCISSVRAESKVSLSKEYSTNPHYQACKAAGGTPREISECDASVSLWCQISTTEECYADQVKDGKCSAGRYSSEVGAIVGISPRVLCDSPDGQ